MARPKKVKVVVDDEIIENPEEVTIEDVTEDITSVIEVTKTGLPEGIIDTGNRINGKRELKNVLEGFTFIEE